jgi:hypothetical protein
VEARRRDQGHELLDELLELEDDVGRAVAPALLELVEEPSVRSRERRSVATGGRATWRHLKVVEAPGIEPEQRCVVPPGYGGI